MDPDQREPHWQTLAAQLATSDERLVFFCSYVLEMHPRTLCQHCPDRVSDVQTVYRLKRQVLATLRDSGAV